MASRKPTVDEITELRWELEPEFLNWHLQQYRDDRFYNLLFDVTVGKMPDGFEMVRPPSAQTIVDLIADHASGNFPQIHVPRRKNSGDAESQATLMEKSAQGFWYRNMTNNNPLRQWAQSGGLRGAICAALLYDPSGQPDLPLPSDFGGGVDSEEYKDAKAEAVALRRSWWPFKLQVIDPMEVYPDPATDGEAFVIHAFRRKVYDVLRVWPTWDRYVPGRTTPLKLTEYVDYISYSSPEYRAYIVCEGSGSKGVALNKSGGGVQKHGCGFNPYFFTPGGFGSPFGLPEHRYAGALTKVADLLKLEARRMTHLDAIVAQQAFPNLLFQDGIEPNLELGGGTRVPVGTKLDDAMKEVRPIVPIEPIAQELSLVRAAIQRGTIPDSLGAEPNKSEESGYLRSLKIGTGRARIRSLTNALERVTAWGTAGYFRLVENKVKGPVSTWGRNLGKEQEFITLEPDDIKGHYEVWIKLTPSLPNDESVDIANGTKLYDRGLIPGRDMLETYSGRENAIELMEERLGEDALKSPQMMQQILGEALGTTNSTGGPVGTPGFTSGLQGLGPAAPVGPTANPQSNAGIGAPRSIPTPPPAPGSVGEANNVIGRTATGGAPVAGPLAGIQRGRA